MHLAVLRAVPIVSESIRYGHEIQLYGLDQPEREVCRPPSVLKILPNGSFWCLETVRAEKCAQALRHNTRPLSNPHENLDAVPFHQVLFPNSETL